MDQIATFLKYPFHTESHLHSGHIFQYQEPDAQSTASNSGFGQGSLTAFLRRLGRVFNKVHTGTRAFNFPKCSPRQAHF